VDKEEIAVLNILLISYTIRVYKIKKYLFVLNFIFQRFMPNQEIMWYYPAMCRSLPVDTPGTATLFGIATCTIWWLHLRMVINFTNIWKTLEPLEHALIQRQETWPYSLWKSQINSFITAREKIQEDLEYSFLFIVVI
jgi:hypothetical protein